MSTKKSDLLHVYRIPGDSEDQLIRKARRNELLSTINSIRSEYCYNIEVAPGKSLNDDDRKKLVWLFAETFEPENIDGNSFLDALYFNQSHANISKLALIEVGPRLAFTTAWSSNCVSMCQACGILNVTRIERSRRYFIESSEVLSGNAISAFASLVHDRMTECIYPTPLTSFFNGVIPESVKTIPILSEGKEALKKFNEIKGLGFDDWDLDFYTSMFADTLKRDPTDVECFDLAQSNSEHSRHWFFGGNMIIDDEAKNESLFAMVKATLPKESNSIIAFHDNSSGIRGFSVPYFHPKDPMKPSPMVVTGATMHPILTAETHNFPSGVAPFPGAETGTGGRLRDVQATGRGAHSLAGISAYCVGNLHIPDYNLPWEQDPAITPYPSNLARPLTIEIDASNGASDYGNKYGEPVVAGFTRSFGQVLPSGERVEYIKPIMFTAGVGYVNDAHVSKGVPESGMIVCKIGGPAYRIGVGGGAASSRIQGTADVALDFDAVQRGDAEMENRMNRVIRACIDMLKDNPIVSIHDQGAGGNGNVLKEIVDPLGARYELRKIPVGDASMSVSEIWTAEYQENNAFLVRAADLDTVLNIGNRENCPVTAIGEVTGDGRVIVIDSQSTSVDAPYDLPLSLVLGNMPKKTFSYKTPTKLLRELNLPSNLSVTAAYERVGRLLDVGSKRFLTNKVDRSVTGLIAQQQCVGPMSMPISNVAVLALSPYARQGMAVAIGEQPIKGLVDNKAQARMTVGEVLTNLVFASITKLEDIKMSGNWMWAPKLGDEGANMWHACEALRDALVGLGPSIDGGKDSLSMAAKVSGTYVKSPGTLTLTAYASCPDITLTVTPDLKLADIGVLVFVDLSDGHCRCGGTAISTVYGQIGHEAPDMNNPDVLKRGFYVTQELIRDRRLLSGHDRSDGGLLITLVEMALAGDSGIEVSLSSVSNPWGNIGQLYNEELGWVFEVHPDNLPKVLDAYNKSNIPAKTIGKVVSHKAVRISINEDEVFNMSITDCRRIWEDTSIHLEQLQCHPDCVAEEADALFGSNPRKGINYIIPHIPVPSSVIVSNRPRVAVIRQEGSNGDREMLASFHAAGAEVWDVNMVDLVSGKITLDQFRGIAFCGGFSYADVNDSAKGWAGVIRFNSSLLSQFQWFRNQIDRFSLGVCNGCQLLALLGWIPFPDMTTNDAASSTVDTAKPLKDDMLLSSPWKEELQPRFLHNKSGRYESRWVTVKIEPSPAIMLRGLEGSQLGIWVAHGEGRAFFPHADHINLVEKYHLAPIRYVDDDGKITQQYPMNPNSSPLGIAGMCSLDGRHLALMPHPERCVQYWQWPYKPKGVDIATMPAVDIGDGASILPSPWLKMFQNAIDFCHGDA